MRPEPTARCAVNWSSVQREALAHLRRERRIGIGTARTLEHDLDLEDARLA